MTEAPGRQARDGASGDVRPAFEPLVPADAIVGGAELPFSPRFGDVYHASAGAFAQARHVFLQGNGLPARWRGRQGFTVCETGFGLGLNFLALWQAWRNDPQRCARLHVASVEAHPFSRAQLAEWHRKLVPDALRALSGALLDAWPPLLPGLHRLEFDQGAVTLTLGFGRAEVVVPQWRLAADAFFLDGFAPARNPGMWSPVLMAQLAALGAPGATAASWTSAGAVRRALADAGFGVQKRPGFAGKRDMTVACLSRVGAVAAGVLAGRRPAGRALVVGAGVAGAGVAEALGAAGWEVAVWAAGPGESDGAVPASPGLSARGPTAVAAGLRGQDAADARAAATMAARPGHVAAALTPLADRDDSPRARLARAAAMLAATRWAGAIAPACALPLPPAEAVAVRCGTVQIAPRRQARSAEQLAHWQAGLAALRFPTEWMRCVDHAEAGAIAGQPVGRGGVFFPGGLLVRPAALRHHLLSARGVSVHRGRIARLRRQGEGWQALDAAGRVLDEADVVVVAAAGAAPALLRDSGVDWPLGAAMRTVAGQITLMPASCAPAAPRCIVAGDGYALPAIDGWQIVGSTYDHDTSAEAVAPVTDEGHAINLAHRRVLLPGAGPALPAAGWAGWRAVLPGRLPAIGELPDTSGMLLATAYASRGMSLCVVGGRVLADALAGAPQALEQDLLAAVNPARPA